MAWVDFLEKLLKRRIRSKTYQDFGVGTLILSGKGSDSSGLTPIFPLRGRVPVASDPISETF